MGTEPHADAPPMISVVVPTWNHARLLPGCLDSLLAQDYPADRFEIVVVDDGSTDETPAAVARYARRGGLPKIVPVRVPHGGLNPARNAGIAASSGDVIAFVDDDEIAPADHLSRAAALLADHGDLSGVGGPAIDDGKGRLRTCAACSLGTVVLNENRAATLPVLLGGNMFVPRDVFRAVGGFEPTLSGRGDETEWFDRAGRTFFYDPELLVWHRCDQFTLWQLCRTQFRQGRALPRWSALRGKPYRPRPRRLLHLLGHGVRRRCAKGLVNASRELGATFEWARPRRRAAP